MPSDAVSNLHVNQLSFSNASVANILPLDGRVYVARERQFGIYIRSFEALCVCL